MQVSHLLRSAKLGYLRGNTRLVNKCGLIARYKSQLTGSEDSEDCTINSFVQQFQRNPTQVADELAKTLTPAQRALLSASIADHHGKHHALDEKYVEELFNSVDETPTDAPGFLTRNEFQKALLAHHALNLAKNSEKTEAPSYATLKVLFFASAIPFLAFGFLDNFIMLIAGEEIDHMFGARFGLSTLASAGLGNAIADVIGIGAANSIETSVKKLPLFKNPSHNLTKAQRNMRSVQITKQMGAMIGVAIGCLLGLTPLFMTDAFFVHQSEVTDAIKAASSLVVKSAEP
mmetsp:Transcript_4240/g.7557  ORF Transcript_4240/g.7557 Transcript_4240/m.7557 type:complete len:289 (-) Transcript_4240:2504-3370(-)